MKELLWPILCNSLAYIVYNKHSKNIESIHVIFDEYNNGKLTDSILQNLNLNKHSDDKKGEAREASATKDNYRNNLSIQIMKRFHLKKKINPLMREVLI